MIRKTGRVQRRKLIVGQREGVGVGIVVRQIGAVQLRFAHQDSVGQATRVRVEVVHLAKVLIGKIALPVMADIERRGIIKMRRRNGGAIR